MARDWRLIPEVTSNLAALPAIRVHGKFLSRDCGKLLLKAMRLPGVSGALDLSEKLALRRRLNELADANVNALILTEAQADTVLGVVGQAGLYAIVEVAIEPRDLNSDDNIRAAIARVAQTVSVLRGYPALIGFLIDCPVEGSALPPSAFKRLSSELAALTRTIHESRADQLVAFERRVDLSAIAMDGEEPYREFCKKPFAGFCGEFPGDLCEDLTYVNLARINRADPGPAIIALHRLAAAHPLVIEFGEELPVQEEMVTHAFGLGTAGVVAPAMRPALSPGRQNVWMVNAGELLPFATVDGTIAPLPATAPMASVVVAARDDERTIAACLESIGCLQYPNYEVIVVDDGSRDRTAEIAASVGGSRPLRIMREPRAGFGAACNAATGAARGQLIAFTRADCVVDADWLTLAVRIMHDGSLDACCGPIYLSHTTGAATPTTVSRRARSRRAIASLANALSADAANDYAGWRTRNMIVRKASLIAVGGFDSRFVDGGSGADLSTRMSDTRMTLGWCPAGFVWCSASNGVGEFYRQRISHGRADAVLAIKHPGRFSTATRLTHQMAAIEGHRRARVDGTRESVVVRSLSAIFSLSGAIVQALACRLYMIGANRVQAAPNDSNGNDYDSTCHLPIANNHVSTAHSAAHR